MLVYERAQHEEQFLPPCPPWRRAEEGQLPVLITLKAGIPENFILTPS